MSVFNIIKRPIITEKPEILRREQNVYTFEVSNKANKIEIKKAEEKIFGIKEGGLYTMGSQTETEVGSFEDIFGTGEPAQNTNTSPNQPAQNTNTSPNQPITDPLLILDYRDALIAKYGEEAVKNFTDEQALQAKQKNKI